MQIFENKAQIISAIVAVALFMEQVDSTIIATALPTIAQSIGETPLRLNVAITCYLLSLAVFVPISGWTAGSVLLSSRCV